MVGNIDWAEWAGKMVQQVKEFDTKPDDLSFITGTHMVGENQHLQVVPCPLHVLFPPHPPINWLPRWNMEGCRQMGRSDEGGRELPTLGDRLIPYRQ